MTKRLHPVGITRVAENATTAARDMAAAEEPLEIRLNGAPFAVIMRTPGADRDLTAGFLLAERIISGPDDLGTIRHCTDPQAGDLQNVINVTLAGVVAERLGEILSTRRAVTSSTSCGICGRQTIDDLLEAMPRIPAGFRITRRVVEGLSDRLRAAQVVFDETGGLHAAGLFDAQGVLVANAEDVGRHSAVDKVIGGQLLLERLPLNDRILFVSGRTSFEIVQKAIVAGIPIVASVSAPSSLAVALAADAGMSLLGFVRGRSFNIYSGSERVELG